MPTSTWENLDPVRRERVLLAAMTEFGRHGYSAGSLNVIARDAGVAKGSLFQYFTDKLDFFAHVTEYTSERVRSHMAPWLAGPPAGRDFVEFFLDAVDAWIDYFGDHPLERAVTAATNLEIDPEVRVAVRAPAHRMYAEGIRPLLEAARDSGELRADADLDAVLELLLVFLPHLALSPYEPGLSAVIGLYGQSTEDLRVSARRLLAPVFAAVASPAQPVR